MKNLLLRVEQFLRWLVEMSPEERTAQAATVSEAAQALIDEIEPAIDDLPDSATDEI